MSKGKSTSKKNKSTKKKISFSSVDFKKNNQFFYLLTTIALVFLVYSFSLFRPWLPFDERILFKEVLFPIPSKIDEVKEIINLFASNYHIESMNTFFSSNLTIRSNPIAARLIILTSWLFKKNAVFYHLLQLSIHLTNTTLVWAVLYKTTNLFSVKENTKKLFDKKLVIISLFTAIWALHGANTEAVLLTTNWSTLLTYSLCFGFILFEISRIAKNNFSFSISKTLITSFLFTLTMFLTEYGYSLPVILFFIVFSYLLKQIGSIKKVISISIIQTLPYFIGVFIFAFISLFKPDSPFVNLLSEKSELFGNYSAAYIFFERNLWLSPQIFVHLMTLLCFPKTLSLYQSDLTLQSSTLIQPYSIFCTSIYLAFIMLPVFFFFILRNNNLKSLCILIYAFFFSLFPFLHILLPTYCLSADRYCYFPSFFFLLLALTAIFVLLPEIDTKKFQMITVVLSFVLILLTARTIIRINEWNNPYLLYKASAEAEKLPLYKAHKLIVFSSYLSELGKDSEVKASLGRSLNLLTRSMKELKQLKLKYPKQPITLKQYGLDTDSLILKNAYLIATVKYDNFREPAKDVLSFYEKYITRYLKLAFVNQIAFYAEILSSSGEDEKAKSILEYGLKRFPYSSAILLAFAEYYLQKHELDNAFPVLEKAYKIFPNDLGVISKFYKYYELKNDPLNQARFSYLLGLRNHDAQSYQRAVQIYLSLKELPSAKLALKKLIRISGETPLTILLSINYLDLIGNRDKILPLLNKAYALSKAQGQSENIQVTKLILANLININTLSGNTQNAKKYLDELKTVKNLTVEDKKLIEKFNLTLSTTKS